MPGHTSPWITKQIKYSGTLYTESNPHSWRHTNKSMHTSELGPRTCTVKLLRSSVMPLILSAWVKSEERGWSNRGWKGLWGSGGCVDAEACGDHVSPTPPLSPPPKVLNVKCLTGRLSEEELQRTMAHWSQAGGCAECRGSCSQAGFCQLPHARITLPFCTAITGMLLHWESMISWLYWQYPIVIIHLHMVVLQFWFADMLSLKHYREWAGNKHWFCTDPPNSGFPDDQLFHLF